LGCEENPEGTRFEATLRKTTREETKPSKIGQKKTPKLPPCGDARKIRKERKGRYDKNAI
jgi:hypothetical protein